MSIMRLLYLSVLCLFSSSLFAQITLTTLPSGGNKKAMVGERIGLTDAECTLIFSNNASSWGSFYYDDKEDA